MGEIAVTDEENLKLFREERNAALLSGDEQKIRNYVRTWGEQEMPKDPEVFWAAVHKAITGCKDMPLEKRQESKRWLTDHGFKSWDDGDL